MLWGRPSIRDLDGVRRIEGWLGGFACAVLVVSHDRQFLDEEVDPIVEIENCRLQEYEGNHSAWCT
jgi:ATP-binding cassette subfamily F protein 3